jgi:HAD superfamily hydrolase (TIGR01509 family)
LWNRVGVSREYEDEYLTRFELQDRLHDFFAAARKHFDSIACLSNDVSEWSRKLRGQFELESYIDDWFISGDMELRKPDRKIYERMLAELGVAPSQLLFVDDRLKNLDSAADVGIQTAYFDVVGNGSANGHWRIDRLEALLEG